MARFFDPDRGLYEVERDEDGFNLFFRSVDGLRCIPISDATAVLLGRELLKDPTAIPGFIERVI